MSVKNTSKNTNNQEPIIKSDISTMWMNIEDIHPYANNPRKNDDAVQSVANSIKEFGWQQLIVVDKDGVIIAGHTRYKAALSLGIKEIPVHIANNLTDEQVKAYRLADNKTHDLSSWDDDLLLDELGSIDSIDMSLFGFDEHEIQMDIEEDEYDVEVPEEPQTKYGDIYHLGDHILMCGDSTKKEDVDKLIGSNKADMVFTDPPWNVDYGGSIKEDNPQGYKPRTIMNDSMSTEDFKKFMNASFMMMKESCRDGAMVYIVMSAQEWGNMMLSLKDNGFHWSSTIIWNKNAHIMSRKDYHTKYEPIWYGWEDSGPRICPLTDRKQNDVWDVNKPTKSVEHPTMKPIELIARAVQNSSRKGSIVLDLFGGSGSTMIACEQLGRKNLSMELDPAYCDVIVDRWEKYTGRNAEKLIGVDENGS
jgi:DNA modification methylase